MPTFRLTIRFLVPAYHGRADGGEPEWPPSPLRAFQALVAAAAARWRSAQLEDYAGPALEWLESLGHPDVLAPVGRTTDRPYRLYVPNNATDLVAASWVRGNLDASVADHRTEKDVRPTWLLSGDTVHFDWLLTPEQYTTGIVHREALRGMSRSITHLGWGIDQAIGMADFHDASPGPEEVKPGSKVAERWQPVPTGGKPLRVPILGTFAALQVRHSEFLRRLSSGGLNPVPPLTTFRVVGYRRTTDTTPRPFAAFELRTPDFERFRQFAPTRHACAVAKMVRNALAELARDMRPFGWADETINAFVCGRSSDGEHCACGPDADRRFAYLPLPTLARRGEESVVVGSIRRVLVVGPPGGEREVRWARVLSGRELLPDEDNTLPAALRFIDRPTDALRRDLNLGPYVGTGVVWSTVTPVVLPGFDDGNADKAKRLLCKAFEQAEVSPELVRAASASLEWRRVGFRPGLDLANRYCVSSHHMHLPRYHVRITWPVPVRGPLCVGAGRYYGIGLFATEEST